MRNIILILITLVLAGCGDGEELDVIQYATPTDTISISSEWGTAEINSITAGGDMWHNADPDLINLQFVISDKNPQVRINPDKKDGTCTTLLWQNKKPIMECAPTGNSLQLFAHELGHMIGASHNHDNRDSIMAPSVYWGSGIDPADIAQIRARWR